MRERGILFSGPMVRQILAGVKTQTRRAVKPQKGSLLESVWEQRPDFRVEHVEGSLFVAKWTHGSNGPVRCPYGQPGDRLWVRETHAPRYFDDGRPGYRADWTPSSADHVPEPRWTPSLLMKRTASRITLAVESIRVERAQAISDEDIIAEGVNANVVRELWQDAKKKDRRAAGMHPERPVLLNTTNVGQDREWGLVLLSRRELWRLAWTLINGPAAWDANPWVWCIDFKPIDASTESAPPSA